jgi:hypothetical protein
MESKTLRDQQQEFDLPQHFPLVLTSPQPNMPQTSPGVDTDVFDGFAGSFAQVHHRGTLGAASEPSHCRLAEWNSRGIP